MKKLSIFFLLFAVLVSCNPVKRVLENEHLLTKNTVYIDSVKNRNSEAEKYILQKPNKKIIFWPVSLYFYNLGNKNKPKTPSEWGEKNKRSYTFIKGVFSEKQSIAYAKTFIGLNNWYLTAGEAPTIISDKKISKTENNLRTYFMTQGYFKAKVRSKKHLGKHKKGAVTYFIEKDKPSFLDTISIQIESPVLASLYASEQEKSFLKTGEQYKNRNFVDEAKRIIKHFRNNGIYHFSEANLGFYVDTLIAKQKANIEIRITDRIIEKNGNYTSEPFEKQKITKINVVTDYSFSKKNDTYLDTISYKGFSFLAHKKIKYNPKYLSKSLFIKPNSIYKDSLRKLTRNHLKSLKNFKSITIKFEKIKDKKNELEMNIFLVPTEKFTIGTETELTHSNIRNIAISGKFSIINRNAFRGAELLKLSFLGSYFNSNKGPGWEIGTDASLEIPRFVAPFGLNKLVPKAMNPKTVFSVGTSIQDNIGLDRQTFSALIDYKWKFNRKKTIQLEIFNTQYIKNLNVQKYFTIYKSEYTKLNEVARIFHNDPTYSLNSENETVNFMNTVFNDTNFQNSNPTEYQDNANILKRYNIITSDFLIPVISYSFTYNNQEGFKDNNFSSFRIRVANSGNIMGLLSKKKNANNKKTVFKIPIAQYFKLDIEHKKFWDVGSNSVFGIRSLLGVIIPYDDSNIPFTKSYFAGGSNDIRAWQTYSLGPGKSNSGLEYNIGSLKFLTSFEYRFDVIGKLKGALFLDAGNIWDISNSSFVDSNRKFNGIKSLQNIAIGTGFGARVDFNFLVVRLDLGFKTYEPYLNGNKWFRNYNFDNAVLNIGINYPF